MKTLTRRLCKLEDQFGIGSGKPQLLVVLCRSGQGLALGSDRCIQVLRECGSLRAGPIGVVNLGNIPQGLNAEQTEKFLRENGASLRVTQD